MKGKFITIEGTEGVGKSTQARLVGNYLERCGIPYIVTREPGGDEVAEKIRQIILDAKNSSMTYETEALLYAASRTQHCKTVIIPALEAGKIVICDRFFDSSIIYQGYGRQLGVDFVKKINDYAIKNCYPDLTILLDLPPEMGFKRKGGADKSDRIETSGADFFKRVNDGYQKLKEDTDRIVSINPSGDKLDTNNKILILLRQRGIID